MIGASISADIDRSFNCEAAECVDGGYSLAWVNSRCERIQTWANSLGAASITCISFRHDEEARATIVSRDSSVQEITANGRGVRGGPRADKAKTPWESLDLAYRDLPDDCRPADATFALLIVRTNDEGKECRVYDRRRLPKQVRLILSLLPDPAPLGEHVQAIASKAYRAPNYKKGDQLCLSESGLRLVRVSSTGSYEITQIDAQGEWKPVAVGVLKDRHGIDGLRRSSSPGGYVLTSDGNAGGVKVVDLLRLDDQMSLQPIWTQAVTTRMQWLDTSSYSDVGFFNRDGNLEVWGPAAELQRDVVLKSPLDCKKIVVSNNIKTAIALSNSGAMELWNCEQGKSAGSLAGQVRWISGSFSPDNKHAVVTILSERADVKTVLYDVISAQSIGSLWSYQVAPKCKFEKVFWLGDSNIIIGYRRGETPYNAGQLSVWRRRDLMHLADLVGPHDLNAGIWCVQRSDYTEVIGASTTGHLHSWELSSFLKNWRQE